MTESEARSKIKWRIEVAREIAGNGVDGKAFEDLEIAIQALKEIRKYREMEERLNGISVKQVVDGFIKQVENETQEEYKQGRILTNKEAEDLNEYRELGTVEELQVAKRMYDKFCESSKDAFKASKDKENEFKEKMRKAFGGC